MKIMRECWTIAKNYSQVKEMQVNGMTNVCQIKRGISIILQWHCSRADVEI